MNNEKAQTLGNIVNEINEKLTLAEAMGLQAREAVLEGLQDTIRNVEMQNLFELMQGPEVGLRLVLSIQEALGAVNEALTTRNYAPIHMKDFELATIEALEASTGKDIMELIELAQS